MTRSCTVPALQAACMRTRHDVRGDNNSYSPICVGIGITELLLSWPEAMERNIMLHMILPDSVQACAVHNSPQQPVSQVVCVKILQAGESTFRLPMMVKSGRQHCTVHKATQIFSSLGSCNSHTLSQTAPSCAVMFGLASLLASVNVSTPACLTCYCRTASQWQASASEK